MLDQQPRYDSYRDSGVDWIGSFPCDWSIVRNGALFREVKDPGNDDLPILSVSIHSGVSSEELTEEENIRSAIKIADRTSYKEVKPGYIAYNMMRAWQGGIGFVSTHGMVSPAYVVAKPIVKINAAFFEYLYRTDLFIGQMDRFSKGITDFRKRLYWEEFKTLLTVVPPLTIQDRIVKFLDEKTAEIDAAIEKKRRLIDLLNEQKAILFNRAVTKGLNPNAPMKDSGVDWIGEIPAHWDVKRVKHVAQVSPSKTGDNVKRNDTLAVFLPMEAISRLGEIDQTNVRPTREVFDGLTYFQRGDVVVAKITPCFENGKGAWLVGLETTYGFGTTELHVLRPKQVHGGFLHLLLSRKDFLLHGEEFMEGSAGQKRVPTDFIADYLFGMPPMEEQVAIKAHCDATSKDYSTAVNHQNTGINTLNEFKKTLIANAVTGKIKI